MSHTVFYRKYRPDSFAKLIGQEAVAETLLQALKENIVSHAYLLCGPRGTGKTTIARLIAKGVNCTTPQPNGEPCNACNNCVAIREGSFPDIIEIDAASNRSIDDVRDLKEKVHFLPLQGLKKVYIIDEVHMLTKEAFNALLKTLEEPPAHVHFILATTERHKVPATIVSRTQNFTLKPLTDEKIISLLKRVAEAEGIVADEEALAMIAQASEGGLRDALTLMEQCLLEKKITVEHVVGQLGFVRLEIVKQFVSLWQTGDAASKLSYLKDLYSQGILVDQFVKQATLYLRDALHQHIGGSNEERSWYIRAIEALLECERQFYISPLPILALELAYLNVTAMGESSTKSEGQQSRGGGEGLGVKSEEQTPKSKEMSSSVVVEMTAQAPTPQVVKSEPTVPMTQPELNTSHFAQHTTNPTSPAPVVNQGLQSRWLQAVKSLPPTLRMALRSSEIIKENNQISIYLNSQFEVTKIGTIAGIQSIRDLLSSQLGENLDVVLKVKEDQPQAAEILSRVQSIFGTQTTPA